LGSFRGSIAEISLEDILYEYRNSDTCVVSIATGWPHKVGPQKVKERRGQLTGGQYDLEPDFS
jgi:hypothetical protein